MSLSGDRKDIVHAVLGMNLLEQGTLALTRGVSAPRNEFSKIERILGVNYLTEGR